jgi:hypothetical protein
MMQAQEPDSATHYPDLFSEGENDGSNLNKFFEAEFYVATKKIQNF